MATSKNTEGWKEAKKRCRLNEADIQMAKELGLTPKSLLKNIPTPDQKWKAPVHLWLRDLYESKFGKRVTVKPTPNKETMKKKKVDKSSFISLEDLPF